MTYRVFNIDDELVFAELSGDYNPIHVDPIVSRRFMFGQSIVHGLHLVLWAIDVFIKQNTDLGKLTSIKVNFPKPVVFEVPVEYNVVSECNGLSVIEITQNNILCAKIKLEFNSKMKDDFEVNEAWFINGNPEKRFPSELGIEDMANKAGVLDQYLNKVEFSKVFPNVYKFINKYHIATILSTTRLVGMDCPGLHSLISAFEYSFNESDAIDYRLNYKVSKVDSRFGMIMINLSGLNFTGTIKTFLRPIPVSQMKYTDVLGIVNPFEFKSQRALIIGGSRGLGEIATKILAAGGASVRFSYYKGEADAKRIVDEISSNNGCVKAFKFNVLDSASWTINLSDDWHPTHCYYFPTPFIFSGNKGIFSEKLLNDFNSIYVTSFIKLVGFLRNKGTLNYFYPSTTAIDEMPDNMVEYTISKFAAQKACDILQNIYRSIKIESYKFPRMETDQTVSFLPVNNHDPFKLTLTNLRSFNSLSAHK